MKKIALILLALMLFLAGCAGPGLQETGPETTAMTEQTEPAPTVQTTAPAPTDPAPVQTQPTAPAPVQTQPTEPETVIPEEGEPLSNVDIERYQQLFSLQRDGYASHPVNWYNRILAATFDCPENVDLSFLFSGGNGSPFKKLTDGDKDYLSGKGMNMEMDITKVSAEEANAVLLAYLGLTWDETNGIGADKYVSSRNGNYLYRNMNGTVAAEDFTILAGAVLEDGTIRLYYQLGSGDELRAITMRSRLMEGETGYHILSNVVLG